MSTETETNPTKQCTVCKEHKTFNKFYSSKKGYIQSKCRICTTLYNREYKKNNVAKYTKLFICECGGRYNREHRTQHLKTQRHIKFLGSVDQDPIIIPSIICLCGGRYVKQNKTKHCRTKIHQRYVDKNKDEVKEDK